jgi:hypothetical protein
MVVTNKDRRETRHNERRDYHRNYRSDYRRNYHSRSDPFKQLLRSPINSRGRFFLRLNATNAKVRSENNFLGIDFFLGMVRSFDVMRRTHTSVVLDDIDRDLYRHLRRLLQNALNEGRLSVDFEHGRINQLRTKLYLSHPTLLEDDQLLISLLRGEFLQEHMELHMSTFGFVLFETERYVNIRHVGIYSENP